MIDSQIKYFFRIFYYFFSLGFSFLNFNWEPFLQLRLRFEAFPDLRYFPEYFWSQLPFNLINLDIHF